MGSPAYGRIDCTDQEFAAKYETAGPSWIGKKYGVSARSVAYRRANVERRLKRDLLLPYLSLPRLEYPGELHIEVKTGVVISASDFHYWPGGPCVMHRAIIYLCKELRPRAFIANGDIIDGATISRHARIGWESRPTFKQELETAQDRMHEIASACPRGCQKTWPLGNHDARFETRIANECPELEGIDGIHLKDNFPIWQPCMSTWINGEQIQFKHRFLGGKHSTYNNVLHAGTSICTGHDHAANIRMHNDNRRLTRYGVNTGMIADKESKQFHYTEANPKDWREAIGVFTFTGGFMLQPELALKVDEDTFQFRGNLIRV